jgi:hypothetical protein
MRTFLVFSVRCACAGRHSGPHDYTSAAPEPPESAARCPMVLTVPLESYGPDTFMPVFPEKLQQGRALQRAAADGASLSYIERGSAS